MSNPNLNLQQNLEMIYPTFTMIDGRCPIANLVLPLDFKILVPIFYKEKRKEDVESYVQELQKLTVGSELEMEIALNWHPDLGLANIGLGPSADFELNPQDGWPCFQEHNIGIYSGYVGAIIATKYISELIKSR